MKLTYICDAGSSGNKFSRFWLMTFLGFLALVMSVGAVDAEEAGSLRVAMSGQYMPLHGEKDGQRVGFEVDVARVLGKHLGKQVVFLSRSEMGKGTLQAVAEGRADIGLNAITPTADRRKIVDFSRPIAVVRYLVVYDGSSNACANEVRAALGPAYDAAKEALGNVAKPAQDDAAAIQLIREGKARCAVVEEPSLANNMKNAGAVKVLNTPVGESPIAIAVPKGKKREIDELLNQWDVLKYVEMYQNTWKLENTKASEAWTLPYSEWPAEIKVAWKASPDFGMRYYRELREAYRANRLREAVQKLTKGADHATMVAAADTLIKLAGDKPLDENDRPSGKALRVLLDLKLASQTSLDGKKYLVAILYSYLSGGNSKDPVVGNIEDLSSIATSILEADAASQVEVYQLCQSLCRRGQNNSAYNPTYNQTLDKLLVAVFKQSPMGALCRAVYNFYVSCDDDDNFLSGEGTGLYSLDPITYALIKAEDWRRTEELMRKLLEYAVTVEGGEQERFLLQRIIENVEQIAAFNPNLTKRLEPAVVEAMTHVTPEDRSGIRDQYQQLVSAMKAGAEAVNRYEQAMSKFWAYQQEKKVVEPRIYDLRDSAKLAGLPQEVRDYVKQYAPPLEDTGTKNGQSGQADISRNYRYQMDVWDQFSKKVIILALKSGYPPLPFYYDTVSKTIGNFDLGSKNTVGGCESGSDWQMVGVMDLNKDGNPEIMFECPPMEGGIGAYSYQEWKNGKFTLRKLS